MKNNFKKFIHRDLPCAAKWRWSTIRLFNDETQSCHRVQPDQIPEDFDSFHNTKSKLQARKDMLKGIWPGHGCEYCKNIEDGGGISDRMQFNAGLTTSGVPKELFSNRKTVEVTPSIVEIYFRNLCNMSCIYCFPTESSLWNQEEKKFDGHKTHPEFFRPPRDYNIENYQKRVEQMFNWLEKNFDQLTNLHILGGEPLIQDETFKVLDFIEMRENSNLEMLAIFSNLKIEHQKFKKILDQLSVFRKKNKVECITLICSIDCWNEEQEYIRTGINLKQWEENFNLLVKEYPDIEIQLHSTITNIGLTTMFKLLEKRKYYQTFRKDNISHSFSFVDGKPFLHPRIFPDNFFDDDFDRMIEIILSDMTTNDSPIKLEKLRGFKKYLNNCPYQPELVTQLKEFLDIIDRRRGLNWRETFPWLAKFDENKYK
jgi:organic radical activating enzyme